MLQVDGRGWAHGDWAKVPQIRMVVVQNSLDLSPTDSDVVLLQGQAALRGNQGGGNVVVGYKRVLSPNDEIEGSAVLGLRSLLTLTSTRRLGHYTTAAVSANYSWDQGMGLQVTTSRQLYTNTSASLTWVVGPATATGMNFSITHRGTKYVITGKLDLGLVTSISSRLTYLLTDSLSLKVIGRFGTSGIDAELGLVRRFSPTSSFYAGSAVSLHGGTAFKVRYSRAGQVFEFPILLTGDYRDFELLAAATIIPPLASFLLLRYVIRPIRTWQQRRTERQQRSEYADQLKQAAQRAAAEKALLEPVARRRTAAEAAAEGLVILEAAYGILHEYRLARAALEASAGPQQQQQLHQQEHPTVHSKQQQRQPQQQSSNDQGPTPADGPSSSSSTEISSSGTGTSSSSVAEKEVPAGWLDVTEALQYLVHNSKLELHAGISKTGLMGFADVAPQAEKELYVAYCYNRQLFEKVVGDTELLRLPGAGEPVCEAAVADRLWAKYRANFQQQVQQQ